MQRNHVACRGTTFVVGVAFPSSPCARYLLCIRERRNSDHHRRSKNQVRECPPYMREEECRLLLWGLLLLLLFVLDICYALGEEGVATIIDGRKIRWGSVHHTWEKKNVDCCCGGSFLLLLLVLDIGYALGEVGVATIIDGWKIRWASVHHIWEKKNVHHIP